MTAPKDQNGLREALARAEAERDEADRRAGAAERRHASGLDSRLKADHWKRERKAERGYHDNVSFDRVWAETCALADRALAAEAEITRLKEGMEARERANDRLTEMVEKLVLNASVGRVPLAIISAANHLLATLSPKEHPHG